MILSVMRRVFSYLASVATLMLIVPGSRRARRARPERQWRLEYHSIILWRSFHKHLDADDILEQASVVVQAFVI